MTGHGSISIRPERPSDVEVIARLIAAAFRSAPHSSGTEQFIVNALRKANRLAVSLVAEGNAGIVGHVAVSPVSVSDGSADWYGLGPVSVLPACQAQGIGSQLVKHALTALRDTGAAGCVVLGEPGYYGRFGFRPEAALMLLHVPAEYFMALAIRGTLPSGTVSYHEVFDAKD